MEAQLAELPPNRRLSLADDSCASWHDTLDRLPAAAYTCDPSGLITYYNRSAAELWGREPRLHDPADRFCGSFRLYTPGGQPLAHDRCWMALALYHRRPFNGFEVVIERPDGERRSAVMLANPLLDERGELIGGVNVLVDMKDDGVGRSPRSTPKELIATLAHELRNPLAPIRNAVYVLKHLCPKTPDVASALAIIDRQSRQMSRLVDELLDASQLARRKLELRLARVEVADIVRSALETSRPRYDEAGQHLAVSQPLEPVWVSADALRLAQAISDLLDNASRYMHAGGCAWLDVSVEGGDVVVTVSDDGIGIASSSLPHIFDLFTRAADGDNRLKAGLGIGLALARRIVELHGGTLTAHSDGANKGSRFILRIPLVR